MTVLLSKIRGRVRAKLNDADGRHADPDGVSIDMCICDSYLMLQSELPDPTVSIASGLTISANSETFTLPVTISASGYGTGTVEYGGQADIQLASNGHFLTRVPLDTLNGYRNGNATTLYGVPDMFALYEDRGSIVRGLCYPGAQSAQVCNLFVSIKPDDLRDYVGTGGAEGLDTVALNLGREGAAGLASYTAAMLIKRMDEATLKLRRLNAAVADDLMKEAHKLIYQESARVASLESAPHYDPARIAR